MILKQDVFGRIELVERDGRPTVCRVACGSTVPGSRRIARRLARHEQRILERLRHLAGIPRPLGGGDDDRFYRSHLEGVPLYRADATTESYWSALLALLSKVHAAGIAHNDLAKEANILVGGDGTPGIVDFQVALSFRGRGDRRAHPLFALLRREDVRHVLKQKALHRPDLISGGERRLLERRALPVWLWSRTLMKPYQRLVCALGWEPPRGPESR